MANAEDTACTTQDPNAMPVPKIKHDWYQTDTHVVITILIKNMKKEDIKLDMSDTTVSIWHYSDAKKELFELILQI